MLTLMILLFVFFLLLYVIVAGLRLSNEYADENHVCPRTLRRWRREEGRNAFHGIRWNWSFLKGRWK
jgi:hypothetical protein